MVSWNVHRVHHPGLNQAVRHSWTTLVRRVHRARPSPPADQARRLQTFTQLLQHQHHHFSSGWPSCHIFDDSTISCWFTPLSGLNCASPAECNSCSAANGGCSCSGQMHHSVCYLELESPLSCIQSLSCMLSGVGKPPVMRDKQHRRGNTPLWDLSFVFKLEAARGKGRNGRHNRKDPIIVLRPMRAGF